MKTLITASALVLIASTAWAHHDHFGNNPDMYQSPIVDHGPGAPTGTPMQGQGDLYGSHLENPQDVTPNPAAKAERWDPKQELKTRGDTYESHSGQI